MLTAASGFGAEHLERLLGDPGTGLEVARYARSVHTGRTVQSAVDAVATDNTAGCDLYAHSGVPDQCEDAGKNTAVGGNGNCDE